MIVRVEILLFAPSHRFILHIGFSGMRSKKVGARFFLFLATWMLMHELWYNALDVLVDDMLLIQNPWEMCKIE